MILLIIRCGVPQRPPRRTAMFTLTILWDFFMKAHRCQRLNCLQYTLRKNKREAEWMSVLAIAMVSRFNGPSISNLFSLDDCVIIERNCFLPGRRAIKMRHKEESLYAPRSLFDRPSPAFVKNRRDMKLHKYRPMVRPPIPMPGIKPLHMSKSSGDQEHVLDWMIHEDWALLQAIQIYQGLPLNLMILSPGHTPNWDLVADIVNNTSRIYRSPKQCRSRYESVIVPREEGKLLYDITPKKQKKQKSVYKMPQVAEVYFISVIDSRGNICWPKIMVFLIVFF